jgi:hypothetical protein
MSDEDYDAHVADERRALDKLRCQEACQRCRKCVEQMKEAVLEMEIRRKCSEWL